MRRANDAGTGDGGTISDPTEKVLEVYKDNSEMMTLVRMKYWSGQFGWERDRNMDLYIHGKSFKGKCSTANACRGAGCPRN
jgi:hypothetical protein